MRSEIRLLPTAPSATQRTAIAEKRQRLLARITRFLNSGERFIGGVEVEEISTPQDDPQLCANENGAVDEESFWNTPSVEDEQPDDEDGDIFPESQGLWIPSSIGFIAPSVGWENLVEQELQLQIGQANDSLQRLRTHLGQKSVLYRMHVRSSTSVRTDTRSRNDIRRIGLKINKDARSYQRARDAMVNLGAANTILNKYQNLSREHLVLPADLTEENRVGQGSDTLPWLWRVGGVNTRPGSEWDDECKCSDFVNACLYVRPLICIKF